MSAKSTEGLRIKSFFAETVEQAMKAAQRELGPDAFLLDSRDVRQEGASGPSFEVVFGTQPDAVSRPEAPDWRGELAELRRQIENLQRQSANPDTRGRQSGLFANVAQQFEAFGFPGPLAADLAESAYERALARVTRRPAIGTVLEEAGAEILSRVATASGIPDSGVTAVVGPPGSGKTSAIVKLAVRHAIRGYGPIHFVSTDDVKLGGFEELRSYADVTGARFDFAETVDQLDALVRDNAGSLMFIDTPGFSATNQGQSDSLARWLRFHSEIETHLVLPASMRTADLIRTAGRFGALGPSRLLFTKLDETREWGGIFATAVETGLQLSYFSSGPDIPEHLSEAQPGVLLAGLTCGRESGAEIAA